MELDDDEVDTLSTVEDVPGDTELDASLAIPALEDCVYVKLACRSVLVEDNNSVVSDWTELDSIEALVLSLVKPVGPPLLLVSVT